MSESKRRKVAATIYLEIEQKQLLTKVSKEYRVTEASIIRVANREGVRMSDKDNLLKAEDALGDLIFNTTHATALELLTDALSKVRQAFGCLDEENEDNFYGDE